MRGKVQGEHPTINTLSARLALSFGAGLSRSRVWLHSRVTVPGGSRNARTLFHAGLRGLTL
jgi:hypothetical protein